MTTWNLTPHGLVLCRLDGSTQEIPASGHVVRLATTEEPHEDVAGLPCVSTVYGELTGVPLEVAPGDVLLASSMVADRVANKYPACRVLVPDTGPTAVRDAAGRIHGVRQFRRVAVS